jgi:hypothetical protein
MKVAARSRAKRRHSPCSASRRPVASSQGIDQPRGPRRLGVRAPGMHGVATLTEAVASLAALADGLEWGRRPETLAPFHRPVSSLCPSGARHTKSSFGGPCWSESACQVPDIGSGEPSRSLTRGRKHGRPPIDPAIRGALR